MHFDLWWWFWSSLIASQEGFLKVPKTEDTSHDSGAGESDKGITSMFEF